MTGAVRQITGNTKKEQAARRAISQPVVVPETTPPVLEDTTEAVQDVRKKSKRQRGRANTILRGMIGDDSSQQTLSVKQTLGA